MKFHGDGKFWENFVKGINENAWGWGPLPQAPLAQPLNICFITRRNAWKTIAVVSTGLINLKLEICSYIHTILSLIWVFHASILLFKGKNGENTLLATSDGRVYGIGTNTNGCLGFGNSWPQGLPSEMKLSNKGIKGKKFVIPTLFKKLWNSACISTVFLVLPFVY